MLNVLRRLIRPAVAMQKVTAQRAISLAAPMYQMEPSANWISVELNDSVLSYGRCWRNFKQKILISVYQAVSGRLFDLGFDVEDLRELQIKKLQIASAKAKKRPVLLCRITRNEKYQFSEEFVKCGRLHGSHLYTALEYYPSDWSRRESCNLHKAMVEFGKKICSNHPIIFRDMYLILSKNLPRIFLRLESSAWLYQCKKPNITDEELRAELTDLEEEYGPDFHVKCCRLVTKWRFQEEMWANVYRDLGSFTLIRQLAVAPDCNWFMYQNGRTSQLPWTMFYYLRTLPDTPFDPANNTDHIDPQMTEKVYEKVGLVAAAQPEKPIDIVWIPECLNYASWQDERLRAF